MTVFSIQIEIDGPTLARLAHKPETVDAACKIAAKRLKQKVNEAICAQASHQLVAFGSMHYCERCDLMLSE